MNEFLIVGHGLAGAVLAHQLLDRGQKVVVMEGNLHIQQVGFPSVWLTH